MSLFKELFPLHNSGLLVACLLLTIVSIVLSYKGKHKLAIGILFFGGLLLRVFMSHLDPFLHPWDERFHALVAKNMMQHPFIPMLHVNDVLWYDYKNWCGNHIWLHKQPLFLWQMVISMKLFGISEFAIRYPAVLFGALSILLVNRIAYLITENRHIAFIAALLMCFSYFNLQLISGMIGTDQNEVSFDFYVLCSVWAYFEYRLNSKIKWVLLTGFFAGCAVLNKWLPGMLIFAGWGLILLLNIRKEFFWRNAMHFVLALIVCVVIFLPWQLYTFHSFPKEAAWEMKYNTRHLSEAIEGHVGTNYYYLDRFKDYFGMYIGWLLPIGLFCVVLLSKYRNHRSLVLAVIFLGPFVFYSFIVQTKMSCYFMICAAYGYIIVAIAIYHLINNQKIFRFVYIPVAIAVFYTILDLPEITNEHDPKNHSLYYDSWHTMTYNSQLYKHMKDYLPNNVTTVLNARDAVDVMFYNKDIDAYDHMLNEEELKKLTKPHTGVAVFIHGEKNYIPKYVSTYDSLFIIPKQILPIAE